MNTHCPVVMYAHIFYAVLGCLRLKHALLLVYQSSKLQYTIQHFISNGTLRHEVGIMLGVKSKI